MSEKQNSNAPRKCGHCGKPGHYRSTCPLLIKFKRTPTSKVSSKFASSAAKPSPPVTRSAARKSAPETPNNKTSKSANSSSSPVAIDNPKDADFIPEPSSTSESSTADLPDLLDVPVAEDIVVNFEETLLSDISSPSPEKNPSLQAKSLKIKKVKSKSKSVSKSSRYLRVPIKRVPPPPPPRPTSQPLIPRPTNQRWFPPPPSRISATPFSAPPPSRNLSFHRLTQTPRSTQFSLPPRNSTPLISNPPRKPLTPQAAAPVPSVPLAPQPTTITPEPTHTQIPPQPTPPASSSAPPHPTPPSFQSSASNPSLLNISRPNQNEITVMSQAGLSQIYAFHHANGGGIFLSETEAANAIAVKSARGVR